jgi:hypothetical protein
VYLVGFIIRMLCMRCNKNFKYYKMADYAGVSVYVHAVAVYQLFVEVVHYCEILLREYALLFKL